jgi:hypothetical protein
MNCRLDNGQVLRLMSPLWPLAISTVVWRRAAHGYAATREAAMAAFAKSWRGE